MTDTDAILDSLCGAVEVLLNEVISSNQGNYKFDQHIASFSYTSTEIKVNGLGFFVASQPPTTPAQQLPQTAQTVTSPWVTRCSSLLSRYMIRDNSSSDELDFFIKVRRHIFAHGIWIHDGSTAVSHHDY